MAEIRAKEDAKRFGKTAIAEFGGKKNIHNIEEDQITISEQAKLFAKAALVLATLLAVYAALAFIFPVSGPAGFLGYESFGAFIQKGSFVERILFASGVSATVGAVSYAAHKTVETIDKKRTERHVSNLKKKLHKLEKSNATTKEIIDLKAKISEAEEALDVESQADRLKGQSLDRSRRKLNQDIDFIINNPEMPTDEIERTINKAVSEHIGRSGGDSRKIYESVLHKLRDSNVNRGAGTEEFFGVIDKLYDQMDREAGAVPRSQVFNGVQNLKDNLGFQETTPRNKGAQEAIANFFKKYDGSNPHLYNNRTFLKHFKELSMNILNENNIDFSGKPIESVANELIDIAQNARSGSDGVTSDFEVKNLVRDINNVKARATGAATGPSI